MSNEFYVQAPTEVLEYQISWQNLLAVGETLLTSNWTASADLTISAKTIVGSSTICKITGGTIGKRYQVTNTVTTSNGETQITSIFIYSEAK